MGKLYKNDATLNLEKQTSEYISFMEEMEKMGYNHIITPRFSSHEEVEYTYRSIVTPGSSKSQFVDALCDGNTAKVAELLEKYDDLDVNFEGGEPLTTAVYYNHFDLVRFLLEKGADVNIRNGDSLIIACKAGNIDLVKLLLENGADAHVRNNSPIAIASEKGINTMVDLLFSYGAKLESRNYDDSVIFQDVNEVHIL